MTKLVVEWQYVQNGVFSWGEEGLIIDNTKCISCGKCEKACMVSAIKVAKSEEEYKKIEKEIEEDPRTINDLLVDRYGAKPIDKVKGKKSANAWLINKLKDQPADENYKLVIGHSNAPERAKAFEEQLREAGIKNEILTTCIGPVVGTHIGPNCLGIGYITK